MTAEFGAASQLEKIDMLDFADVVAINKYERRGSEDARRDVARQLVRNREAFGQTWQDMPVFGTSAASFNDDGVTALYQHLRDVLIGKGLAADAGLLPPVSVKASTGLTIPVPASRVRYLAEIADAVRGYHAATETQISLVRTTGCAAHRRRASCPAPSSTRPSSAAEDKLDRSTVKALEAWPATVAELLRRRARGQGPRP